MLAALIVPLLASGLLGTALAQDGPPLEFDPLLEVRARAQVGYTDGLHLGLVPENRLLTRSRLGQHLERGPVAAEVAVQGYRGFRQNDRDETVLAAPVLEIYRAWGRLELRLPGEIGAQLTVGRQAITLHKGRILSEYDFSARSNPLDAVRFDLRAGSFHWMLANIRDFDDPSSLDSPGTSVNVVGFDHDDPITAWALDLVSVLDYPGGNTRGTAGLYGSLERERVDLGAEVYVQTRDEVDGIATATLSSAWLGYTFGADRLLSLRAQGEVLSPELVRSAPGGFHTPLGDKYAFQGHMGLFQGPADYGWRGLSDLSLQSSWRPSVRWELDFDVHRFGALEDPAPLGTELDLGLSWFVAPVATVQAGAFSLWAAPELQDLGGIEKRVNTGFVQVSFGL